MDGRRGLRIQPVDGDGRVVYARPTAMNTLVTVYAEAEATKPKRRVAAPQRVHAAWMAQVPARGDVLVVGGQKYEVVGVTWRFTGETAAADLDAVKLGG